MVRQAGYGDIAGVYVKNTKQCMGSKYLCRLTKGELHLQGYRDRIVNKENPLFYKDGNIRKRGRKTVINMLRKQRWVTNQRDRSSLLWGIE